MKRHPHRTGFVPQATRDEACQRVLIPVSTGVRLRLEALEQRRRDAGGADKHEPPSATLLNPDERQYLSTIRRLSYQGETPQPGSVGPSPWYLTLFDASEYAAQRLAMHRQERERVARLVATGEHVRAPAVTVSDCISAGLQAPSTQAVGADYIQASVPVSILRQAGAAQSGRDVARLTQDLLHLLTPYGLAAEEIESLRAQVAAFDALPPPSRTVLETLSHAVVAGLPLVEAEDARREASGGLASRLPVADVWRCAGWERLRALGREVPPLFWE